MSVVNEMLNELQASRTPHRDIKGLIPPIKNKNYFFYIWIVIFIVVVFFMLLFKDKNQEKHLTVQSVTKTNTPITPHYLATKQNDNHVVNSKKPLIIEGKTSHKTSIQKSSEQAIPSDNTLIEKAVIKKPKSLKKTENLIIASRATTANKQLSNILDQWSNSDSLTNKNRMQELLESYSDLPNIWQNALNFIKQRDTSFYQSLLAKSIVQFPNTNHFAIVASRYHMNTGQLDSAYKILSNMKNTLHNKKTYQLLGIILQRQDKHLLAISNYQKSLTFSPDNGEVHMAIGISFNATNQPLLAAEHFVKALTDNSLNELQRRFLNQQLISQKR